MQLSTDTDLCVAEARTHARTCAYRDRNSCFLFSHPPTWLTSGRVHAFAHQCDIGLPLAFGGPEGRALGPRSKVCDVNTLCDQRLPATQRTHSGPSTLQGGRCKPTFCAQCALVASTRHCGLVARGAAQPGFGEKFATSTHFATKAPQRHIQRTIGAISGPKKIEFFWPFFGRFTCATGPCRPSCFLLAKIRVGRTFTRDNQAVWACVFHCQLPIANCQVPSAKRDG